MLPFWFQQLMPLHASVHRFRPLCTNNLLHVTSINLEEHFAMTGAGDAPVVDAELASQSGQTGRLRWLHAP